MCYRCKSGLCAPMCDEVACVESKASRQWIHNPWDYVSGVGYPFDAALIPIVCFPHTYKMKWGEVAYCLQGAKDEPQPE